MKPQHLIAAAGLMLAATVASANVQYTFYANGVTEDYAQQGVAVFNFADDGSSLSITVTDTVAPTAAIQSEISGLNFALTFAPTTMSLTSVTTSQIIDCTNASSPCPSGSGASPYGWGATADGNTFSLGAGFDGSGFAYQPYGIVNADYSALAGAGGLSTPSNNPLLVGPVTFTFALTGLHFAPEVNSVVFAFGDPDFVAAVPEPQSLALLAMALLASVWVGRRSHRRPT